MKLSSLILFLGSSLLTSAFAADLPLASDAVTTQRFFNHPVTMATGPLCQIEIDNRTAFTGYFSGTSPNGIFVRDYPLYPGTTYFLSLINGGTCASYMDVMIEQPLYTRIFMGRVPVNNTITIRPFLGSKAQSSVDLSS